MGEEGRTKERGKMERKKENGNNKLKLRLKIRKDGWMRKSPKCPVIQD